MNKILISGIKRRGDYILRYKGSNTYHRVNARSLAEAIGKFLKGTRLTYSQVEEITPMIMRRYISQGGTNY